MVEREKADPYIGPDGDFADRKRYKMPALSLSDRLNGFPEVELSFMDKDAIAEAGRCLRCHLRLEIKQPLLPPLKVKV